jgi:hypothetical protein
MRGIVREESLETVRPADVKRATVDQTARMRAGFGS